MIQISIQVVKSDSEHRNIGLLLEEFSVRGGMGTEEMLIYDFKREYDRVHSVELDGETGHYYPDRARMNPPEDSLGDAEIWVYNETNEDIDDYFVEPHFHVSKGRIEEKGKTFYEIDIEVKIKNIEQPKHLAVCNW